MIHKFGLLLRKNCTEPFSFFGADLVFFNFVVNIFNVRSIKSEIWSKTLIYFSSPPVVLLADFVFLSNFRGSLRGGKEHSCLVSSMTECLLA